MAEKRVFRLIIGDTSAVAPAAVGTAIASLADGAVGLFDAETNVALDVATASPVDHPKVYLAFGLGSSAVRRTPTFEGRFVTSYLGQAYAAGTPQVADVNTSGVTVTAGDTYTVKLRFTSIPISKIYGYGDFKRTFSIVAATGETITTLVNKFVTAINADNIAAGGNLPVVASNNTDDIRLTTVAVNSNLQGETYLNLTQVHVGTLDGFDGVTTSDSTAQVNPSGTYAHVREIENYEQGYYGGAGIETGLNRIDFPIIVPASNVESAGQYDLYVIEWYDKHPGGPDQTESPLKCYVALEQGTANAAAFEAVLNAYFGSSGLGFDDITL